MTIGRMRRIVCAGMVVVAFLLPVSAFARMPQSLHAFLAAYRCEVVNRLERIYVTGDTAKSRNRFLAVSLAKHPESYVQCIFFDNQTQVNCEASSGYYRTKAGAPRLFWLPRASIAALARIGFSTDDSAGNFVREFSIGARPDLNALADFMLEALHDAYGARAESGLKFSAPFAQRPTTACVPVG